MNAMILKRIQTVLALLFVGSVSILAESDDPFPAVPHSKYQANMTLTAQAVLNGETLTSEAIVAVYHDDQIRGKARPNAEKNILSITVDGDLDDEDIYFKVYTGGRIIEVDQGAQYTYYGKIGSYDNPYIINLPTPVVSNTSSEGWATTCLPFNAAVPDGVEVYTASRIESGVLKIEQVDCTILPKNTPVLLKTESQTSYEWLSRVADSDAVIETNLFKGTTEATTVAAGSVLTLGHATDGNKAIGFWLFNGTTVPANRAYLEKSSGISARGVTIEKNVVTGISEISDSKYPTQDVVYDLQGRKVISHLKKGSLLIVNGKKTVVR